MSVLLVACGGDDEPKRCDEPGYACTWAGKPGEVGFDGDGRHRLDTKLYWTMDMAFAPDGVVWFIDWNNHLVRKVETDDTVTTVLGWTDPIFPGDGAPGGAERTPEGAPGTDVQLNHPTDLAWGEDGELLVMAWHNHKLRSIDTSTGRVRIVAGAGSGFTGDGGPLAMATFRQPKGLEADADGNLYILDQQNFRIRKVDAETGIIATIAGNGTKGTEGDGGPALDAMLDFEAGSNPEPSGGLAIVGDTLYIAETVSSRIRAVDLVGGTIDTVIADDEVLHPRDLELGPDGRLYIADTDNHRILAYDLDSGAIETVAGTGELGLDPDDGLLATETMLARPFSIDFDLDGNLFIADTINSRIVKVTQ